MCRIRSGAEVSDYHKECPSQKYAIHVLQGEEDVFVANVFVIRDLTVTTVAVQHRTEVASVVTGRSSGETCFITPMQYNIQRIFSSVKIENYHKKNSDVFSYFCPKHRSWVQVRTTSAMRLNEYRQSMFWSKNKKNRIPLQTPFSYIKVGLRGYTFHGHFYDGLFVCLLVA